MDALMEDSIQLKVNEALADDVGKGLARMDPVDMRALGLVLGDVIEIAGGRKTVARIAASFAEDCGKKIVQVDGTIRNNARANRGETVTLRKLSRKTAQTLIASPVDFTTLLPDENELQQFGRVLQGLAVTAGDHFNIPLLAGKDRFFHVEATSPQGGVIINQATKFVLKKPDIALKTTSSVAYEDIGGLGRELRLVREMVELPLRYGEIFEKLGIEAPKGVLLYGPPGTGKTLIARAIPNETKLHFIRVNGPEIIHKFYGESEARLREIFEDATRNAPSVIFIDEIDAIAPKRAEVLGDVEKRVVAQLLALMDGMVSRGHVIVIGATNIPEMIDPALRRPGRFDREIVIPVPNAEGRRHIIRIHSRRMPLASDVSLDRLAQITHGFVGADIEALCKEAGMVTLRRYLTVNGDQIPAEEKKTPERIEITLSDFMTALREIEPSATREFFTERSQVRWDQIGGLRSIRETLAAIIDWPEKYPELFREGRVTPPRGILFTGPSGTGKTLMAKALAGETGLSFISISGPTIFSKWLGESEKALHQIFKKATQSAPSILFFDEIDALVGRRGVASEGGAVERMSSQFFNELDGLSDHSQVIVLGATNRVDLVDPALMRAGRLDFILPFPLPDKSDRIEIFRVHTRNRPLAPEVDLLELADRTEGMAGSQIAFLCSRATLIAIAEIIRDPARQGEGQLRVTAQHFKTAIGEARKAEEIPKC